MIDGLAAGIYPLLEAICGIFRHGEARRGADLIYSADAVCGRRGPAARPVEESGGYRYSLEEQPCQASTMILLPS
jgi:hypothetical protein